MSKKKGDQPTKNLPKSAEPVLTIELVPATSWYSNVRANVSRQEWDRIRAGVYKKASSRCEICQGRGSNHPVECHEVWEYDDSTHTQKLVGMIALCPACHSVKHIGLAHLQGRGDRAEAHLAKVNGWTRQQTKDYINASFALWERRSQAEWNLDISLLKDYGVDLNNLKIK